MERATTKEQQEIAKVQERSAIVFKITVALLTSGALGTVIAVVLPTADDSKTPLTLGIAAFLIGGFGAFAGALVNWRAVLTRVRLLYYAQLIALFGLFGCLLGAAVYLVVADPPPRAPSGMTPAVTSSKPAEKHMGDDQQHYFTYEADKAVDGIDETAWRVNGDGVGAWIKLSYPEEVSVNQIGIIPGHDKIDPAGFGTDYFALLHVVRRASFEFSDGTTVQKQFTRDRNTQWLQLDPPVITKSIRIEIEATYPPDKPGGPPGGETAISEIKVR